MSKEALTLALGYMDGTLVTEHLTGYERKRHVMNALREALADHIPDDGKMVEQPQQEPFGYFRAEPFGWTDCAETDDGAVALYERPPAQRAPPKWTDAEVSNGCCGIRWVNAEGVQGVPTREDVEKYLGYASQPSQRAPASQDAIFAVRRSGSHDGDDRPEPWAYTQGWQDAEKYHDITEAICAPFSTAKDG